MYSLHLRSQVCLCVRTLHRRVHQICSQWWRKVAAKLFRSIFGLRTLNQRVFRPLNKRRDQTSNSAVGRFFPSFLVPSPRQTKHPKRTKNQVKFRRNAFGIDWQPFGPKGQIESKIDSFFQDNNQI